MAKYVMANDAERIADELSVFLDRLDTDEGFLMEDEIAVLMESVDILYDYAQFSETHNLIHNS